MKERTTYLAGGRNGRVVVCQDTIRLDLLWKERMERRYCELTRLRQRGHHIPHEGKEQTSHCWIRSDSIGLDLLWKEWTERRSTVEGMDRKEIYCESICRKREGSTHLARGRKGWDGHEILRVDPIRWEREGGAASSDDGAAGVHPTPATAHRVVRPWGDWTSDRMAGWREWKERKERKKEKIPPTGDSMLAQRERKEGKECDLDNRPSRRPTVGD